MHPGRFEPGIMGRALQYFHGRVGFGVLLRLSGQSRSVPGCGRTPLRRRIRTTGRCPD